MTRRGKIIFAKAAMVMGTLPILLWAYEYGPPPGYVGVPGENGGLTCANSGCHTGTTNDPKNKGSVTVTFPGGMTYTPGVAQSLSVTVADPAPTQKAAGFQLTARVASSPSTMAGTFATVDTNTQVICSAPSFDILTYLITNGQTCASLKNGQTLQYIEHTGTTEKFSTGPGGYENSITHGLPYTFTFMWTPPATSVGNITIYVAGNAGVGNPPSDQGDHIYATTYTLTPATAAGPPAISSGGIVSAGAFGGFTAATAGSWIEIYGSNLGPSTGYLWQGSDFNGNNAPTKLQGVSVMVNGQSAFVDYVSAGQVNAQIPSGVGTGPATVIVTTSAGSSNAYTLTLNALEPGLLAPSSFTIGGKQYVVAFNSDSTGAVTDYTLPTGAIPGLTSRPAKPGETLTIYGVGFGPAAASGTQIPPGVIVTQSNSLTNSMQMAFGGTQATLQYFGLAPSFVGLYQFNVVVPTSIANSDSVPLTFNVGGNTGSQTLYTAVHN
jgi:uncharacterized protein (TIGR03437 family)